MNNNITITPGLWKMRNGLKARVAGIDPDADTKHAIVGWRENGAVFSWYADGRWSLHTDSCYDLIEPWVDKPEWPKWPVPPWINWIAQTVHGDWFGYGGKSKPEAVLKSGLWLVTSSCDAFYIPSTYAPTWTGDWTQSLIERPQNANNP